MPAAAGEFDNALRAVEIGIARLDPAEVSQPEESWFREDLTRFDALAIDDLRRLLPEVESAMPDAPAWFERLADALIAWVDEGRIEERGAVRPWPRRSASPRRDAPGPRSRSSSASRASRIWDRQ